MTNTLLDDNTLLEIGQARSALEAFERVGLKEEKFIWLGQPKQGLVLEPLDFFIWLVGLMLLFAGMSGFYQGYNSAVLLTIFFWCVVVGILGGGLMYLPEAIVLLYTQFPLRYLFAFAVVGELLTWLQVGAIGLYCGWAFGALCFLGLYMLFIGHLEDRRQRQEIWYGLTKDNLFIHFPNGLARYSLGQLDVPDLYRRANQQGIITIKGTLDKTYQPTKTYWLRANAPTLYYISDVETIFSLLQEKITTAKAVYQNIYTHE